MTTGESENLHQTDAELPPDEFDQAAELEALAAEAERIDPPDQADGSDQADLVEPEQPTAEVLAQVIGPAFMILAPAWCVQDQEIVMLSESYAKVIDKYFPGGVSLGPEVGAVMVTLAIIGPRLRLPRKLPPPEADQGEPDAPKQPTKEPPKPQTKPKEPGGVDGLSYDVSQNNGKG